ncbi:unnamed protein product [Linum trigynum]|uniref:Uncharacterized protein n=1 Tax=Linum trigynum TaxID=586398 RepID=A0AAV2DVW8_9ROSI
MSQKALKNLPVKPFDHLRGSHGENGSPNFTTKDCPCNVIIHFNSHTVGYGEISHTIDHVKHLVLGGEEGLVEISSYICLSSLLGNPIPIILPKTSYKIFIFCEHK